MNTRSIAILALSASIASFLATGCVREERAPPGGRSAGSRAGFEAPLPDDASPCAAGYRQVRSLFDSLPSDLSRPGLPLEEVARMVADARSRAEGLLRECGEAPFRPEVERILATLLLITFDREVHAGEVRPLELAGRALGLAASAKAAAPTGSRLWGDSMVVTGHLLRKRSLHQADRAARARDLEAMRDAFRRLLEARPDWPERLSLEIQVADSFLGEGDFPRARTHLEKLIDSGTGPGESISLENKLFDALTGCGDLEAMEDLVYRRLAGYPDRIAREDLPARERKTAEGWLELAEFWLGHIRLAMGDVPGARAAFLRHITQIDDREALLSARGESLSDATRIFRDLRSRDLLQFIDHRLGNAPAMDFDLGELWCTSERTTLADARGKVVAAVFRNPGDSRSAPFLKGIDAIWRKRREEGLEALVVGFLVGDAPPAEQVQAMGEDLKGLEVEISAGLDPHQPHPKIIQSMTFVGSPSFVVFDRAGNIAWYLPDPRGLDVGIADRVISRLLKN